MSRENERMRLFTRRAILLGGAKVGLFSLLAGRIYFLQIAQGDKYRTLAEENRINLRLISPPRGQILDRSGAPLAVNQQNYRVVLLPEQIGELNPLLNGINAYVNLSEPDRKRIERDLKNNSGLNAVLVHDNLTWDQVASLSLHTLDLPGVDIEVGEVRAYPYNEILSHIVGYVGAVAQDELDDNETDLNIPGFRIGKSGVEKQYDRILRGDAGNVQLEVNAHGRVVRELARNEPKPGRDLALTIDIGLQQMVQKRLSEEASAAAVVMDVQTGAVYALVSYPGFDPNLFAYGIGQQDWDRLNGDEHTPLLNKAVDGMYAPGSTFKIITAMAGLDADILDPDATTFCPGYLDLGDHRFHCWKKGGHGHVNFIHAMAGSCDTYFYDLGRRVGIDRIEAMAKRFGLGAKTGIDLPHERMGLVPGRAWKMSKRNASWQQGETLVTAIGQGYMLATPLQLAMVVARIANGGKAIKPHLTKRIGTESIEQTSWPSLGLDPEHLEMVQEGMAAVVMEPIGTAYAARVLDERMAMAGKTGTAQVRRISTAERAEGVTSNENLPWKERDHALFLGFAPVSAPRYAVAVIVEHGGSGAHKAAPMARDILVECQKRNVAGI
jgi:penicillin-binding protein 2